MPKRKKRGALKKKKDDSPGDVSECDSLDRPPSAKKVAATSSTSHLEDEVDQVSSFTSVSLLNSSKSESGETAAQSSHFFCNYCKFSADNKLLLVEHMHKHMIKCPNCSFSSLSRAEVSRHCKYEHEKDLEEVSQEVDSSSTECEMDKDPCSACMFCSFMTYSTEHLEKHASHKHPGMLPKSVAKMITKQISAEVRRDDALFYLAISDDGPVRSSAGKGYTSAAAEKSSGTIIIDKSEDVKPDVSCTTDVKSIHRSNLQTEQLAGPVKMHLDKSICSKVIGEEIGNKQTSALVETSSALSLPVKVETMYCLSCPYSNVYIEKLKCHTIVQHPVGAAAAAYNSNGESLAAEDITFFCVRDDCNDSSSDCSSYQKHLMDCCACHRTLKVLERERLRSTITYILEHQRKYKLSPEGGFFEFASPFLGFSLPPTLTRISSSAVREVRSVHQPNERFLDNSHRSVTNIAMMPSENVSQTTGLTYKPHSQLTSVTVSSGSQNMNNYPTDLNHAFFPQHAQSRAPNNHSPDNVGNYQSQIFNSHDPLSMPDQLSIHTTNLPADVRSPQLSQNHSTQAETIFHPQNQRGYSQPSSTESFMRSYQDSSQSNVSWPVSGEAETTILASVPDHSEQSFRMNFQNQHLEVNAEHLSQSNTTFNLTNHIQSDSLPLVQNTGMDLGFTSSHSNYAPISSLVSLDSVGSTSANPNVRNNLTDEFGDNLVTSISNPMTGHHFSGQQQPVNTVFNTTMDLASAETQPQPKMMDLLSDTYSILLSDDFGPEGQIQEPSTNNLIQPQQIPLCSSSYQQEAAVSTQSQVVVSQPSSLMPQGHSTVFQSMQHEGSNFHQPVQDTSLMQSCDNQFSFTPARQSNKNINMLPNLGQDSSFNAAQSSSSYGALRGALTPEESLFIPAVPQQSPNVPNFLGAPGVAHSETVTMQRSGPFTPPKNANNVNKFAGSSPLSPSIYLSGQVPRHRRSDWTHADMRPRGMMVPSGQQRNTLSPVSVPGPQSNVSQRLFLQGRRGYPRSPRMATGRGRMPAPRMPNTRAADDDDDVILTAVTRISPSVNRQPHQQQDGRFAARSVHNPASRGTAQNSPVRNQQRGRGSSARVLYPVPPPPQPQKQFDISKHFEDLACVVNSSLDENEGNDDIEIVCVTPGKDKEKGNQSKAVDASKFSFCCVHCGKDQGSKKVMKQHMKARHNDSLLGAFTNVETGQLLFFCPQLTCEFMTYDEKRLCEHLSKCYDLDRTKPFDFGTAIKNLKSLKIRQLDVRTMGRSLDNPIDLDGQGMKDNFSSSLNDAFGDIVVNASGRHIVRNANLARHTQPSHIRPQSMPVHSESMQSKVPFRHQSPGSTGTRMRPSNYAEQTNMGNRMIRPITSPRHSRQQSNEMRANIRQPVSMSMRMDGRNIREMHPRGPYIAGHRHPVPLRGAPPPIINTPPRLPNGGQQHPVVIVIDADSPERPEEIDQSNSVITEDHDITSQIHASTSDTISSENHLGNLSRHVIQFHENINTNVFEEQCSVPANQDLVSSHPVSANPELNLSDSLITGGNMIDKTSAEEPDALISESADQSYDTITGNFTDYSEPGSSSVELQASSMDVSDIDSYTHDSVSNSYSQENIHASDTDTRLTEESITSAPQNMSSDEAKSNVTSYSTDSASFPAYNVIQSSVTESLNNMTDTQDSVTDTQNSVTDSQNTECSTKSSVNIPLSASSQSVTPIAPTSRHENTPPTTECFDEEEKVNAVVLEKVFAKVPNMPKNLSRRLVAKFKEYAKYRGVKITSDSKVIDEFVSKIYYKGSAADKNINKAQPAPESTLKQSAGDSENPSVAHSVTSSTPDLSDNSVISSGNSATKEAGSEYEVCGKSSKEVPKIETVHEDLTSEESVREEEQTVVGEDSSKQFSANDVITTHVILAQKNLQFSPTFARIASKMLKRKQEARMVQLKTNQIVEQKCTSSMDLDSAGSFDLHSVAKDKEDTTFPSRRNSASDKQVPKVVYPIRRSSSLPLPMSIFPDSPDVLKSSNEDLTEKLNTTPSSSNSGITASVTISTSNNLSLVSPEAYESEVCKSTSEDVTQQNIPLPYQNSFKEETEIAFPPPPPPESGQNPILITSSVDDVVSKHPALEVDIAGKPLKQELFDEYNRVSESDGLNTSKDVHGDKDGEIEKTKKEHTKFGKIVAKYSNITIDRTTGKLLLKKTKRGRPRKRFGIEEKQEIKNTTAEEQVVRRSSRSRKPVNKNYQSDANEIDELMSDDDDEYNIDDDDYDTDTDNEWHGGSSEQPPKKRLKKTATPPDPTAFDSSTKGKFKCWMCRKVFSRCSFAKSHIISKHDAGLCTIFLDKSEETKTPCLLLFCPRNCKYVTLSLEGIKNHVDSCTESLLQDGEKYVEITKQFLENKFSELQDMSLEAVLGTTKVRKPKDPSKAVKVKKPKVISDKPAMASVVIPHSGALVSSEVDKWNISPVAPASVHSVSNNTAASISAVAHKTISCTSDHKPNQIQAVSSIFTTEHDTSAISKTTISQAKKPYQHILSQAVGSHSTNVAPEVTTPHNSYVASSSASRPHTSFQNPLAAQAFPSREQTQARGSFTKHLNLPGVSATSSPADPESEIVYMIEDNGTICLK